MRATVRPGGGRLAGGAFAQSVGRGFEAGAYGGLGWRPREDVAAILRGELVVAPAFGWRALAALEWLW